MALLSARYRAPMELVLWKGRSGFIPDWYLLFVHLHFKTPFPWGHLAPLAMISQPVPSVQRAPSTSRLGPVFPLMTSQSLCPFLLPILLRMGSLTQPPCPDPHSSTSPPSSHSPAAPKSPQPGYLSTASSVAVLASKAQTLPNTLTPRGCQPHHGFVPPGPVTSGSGAQEGMVLLP